MNAKLKMILSMVIYGTIPLFVRGIPLPSSALALMRAAIALACLLLAKAVLKKPMRLKGAGGDVPLLLLSGAAMGFNWILLFEAYRYTTVSVATLSYYFAPVIVMAACPLLFHERATPLQLVCFASSTAGLVLVINAGGTGGSDHVRGVLLGLGAAALYATVILLNKRIRRVGGIDRTILQFAAAAAVLLPYVLLTGAADFGDMTSAGWARLIAVGAVHSGLAYALYFSSIRSLSGQETALLSYIDPLVAVALSMTLLGEPTTPAQLAGGAMILGFTLLNELAGARKANG